ALFRNPHKWTHTKALVNSGQPDRDSSVGREVLRRLAAMDISAGAECYLDNRQYPLVSIMIPTYNRPDLFEQTLQSALAQTYPNVEILVTDNSTNEDTRLLMEKYVEDVRIRYFRNRDARSKADNFRPFEQMARGEYLQWCMDDDVLAPNKLAVMVPVLRDNPGIALVTSQRGVIDAEGNILPEEAVQLMESGAAWQCYGGRDVGRVMLSGTNNFIGEPSAVLFRRRDLQHHYWAADCRGYKAVSDVAMWLELLEKGDMVVFRESLSYYRRHDSQEGQQPEVVLLSRMEWNRLLDEYADRKDFLDGAALRQGKLSLWQDYQKIREYPSVQQAGNFAAYRACMEAIGSQYGK
ncbi:MAG: glycosyltransferase family 2 protein, partial [Selenomonadaceae bacterium]|nr:glycosyltransferase family 2 protein [Selenomonadaceae bacterium]